jgi:small subunit ribosomal protein S16
VLKIRLRRTGAKKQPRYRVVVAESNAPRDGAFVEILGWYNPQADPAQVVINTEKAAMWIERGAQPSDRVAYLLKRAGLGQPVEEAPAAEPEPEPRPAARRRSTRAAAAEAAPEVAKEAAGQTAAATEQGDAGDAEPAASGAGADVPASEAPEEEGSAGASTREA